VAVYDYGQRGVGGAYLVMEFVAGVTLRDELTRSGSLRPQIAADWFDQLLEGMKTAHAAGVLHRDLKPENVLLTKFNDGQAQLKILDFGLAKLRSVDGADSNTPTARLESLTAPGTLLGTVSYMSPKQLSGEEYDLLPSIFVSSLSPGDSGPLIFTPGPREFISSLLLSQIA
jgi:serine/threonine-protein kinase